MIFSAHNECTLESQQQYNRSIATESVFFSFSVKLNRSVFNTLFAMSLF